MRNNVMFLYVRAVVCTRMPHEHPKLLHVYGIQQLQQNRSPRAGHHKKIATRNYRMPLYEYTRMYRVGQKPDCFFESL